MGNIIEIKKASKRFNDKTIFEYLDLDMEKGKAYGFVGEKGSGKSVLLKCICGFFLLSEGTVSVNGEVIGKDTGFIKDAGVVIDRPEFLNDLSGFKNLKVIAEVQKKIGDKEILHTLEQVGLLEHKDKKVKKYSVAMKQKLRITQAIMEKPSVLIIDEPTAGLDKDSADRITEILKEFVAGGGTLVLTGNYKQDVEAFCDAVYEFEDGELVRI